jgi:hypothetical protein
MVLREEKDIQTEEDLVSLVLEDDKTTREAGLMGLAARAAGLSPEHILRSDYVLITSAAGKNVGDIIERFKEEVELANGRKVQVRTHLGKPGVNPGKQGESDNQEASKQEIESVRDKSNRSGYVRTKSDRGIKLALRYLHTHIPGQIWPRLAEIAVAGGDVRAAADELIAQIEEMVEKLT